MPPGSVDSRIRAAAFAWLNERRRAGSDTVRYDDLASFQVDGRRVPLMDRQRGIRKPAALEAALSIRTTFTRPGQVAPYDDAVGADGLQRYRYRGTDPEHPENVAMRRAMWDGLPLIWFVAVAPGTYEAVYPIWLIAEEDHAQQFVVAVDEAQRLMPVGAHLDPAQRAYVQRLTKLRLHQPVFRAKVLRAYDSTCAVCRLRHPNLLDAAHILPDTHPRGLPVVPNGLALCKIHHAAYDQDILGVNADLRVEVRRDVLLERDGPMLRHGLQEMNGVTLLQPRQVAARADRAALDERYRRFLQAG